MNLYMYLEYYKNISFSKLPFNEVDSLLFATLSYLPLDKLDSNVKFNDLYLDIAKINKKDMHGVIENKVIDIINIIKDSERYKDIILSNYANIVNDLVQFEAITFRCKYFTYVAYEGSNSSITGWVENFMLTVKYPTITQDYALDYLENTINDNDKVIYVGGHSKGGNLAMSASMRVNNSIFRRIKKIYNFDGPGFRREQIDTPEFTRMNKKCINYLPTMSLVGILLNNINYTYVISNGKGINQHYLTNWRLFGTFIQKGNNLSRTSNKLRNSLLKTVDELNINDTIKMLNRLNDYFYKNNIIYANDLIKLKFSHIRKLINSYKDIDSDTKRVFIEIIRLVLNPEKKK